ncbi:MAG: hypothetical protein KC492_32760, partial [Myxococcales bacterium]|nr:hypothetical protein [Myxococcales bacterium]
MSPLSRILTLLVLTCLAACDRKPDDRSSAEGSHSTAVSGNSAKPSASSVLPDPITSPLAVRITRGERWVTEFECARCHEGTGVETPPMTKQCVGCHQAILQNRFTFTDTETGKEKAPPATAMRKWRANVVHLRQLP